jgi:GMP synthase (glutamine-hydrolysing)
VTFDLPAGAVRLAANPAYENQAFAYGDLGLALQFHIEADPMRLETWFVGHTMELSAAGVSIPDFRLATAAAARRATENAGRIFGDWLRQIDQR